MGDVIAEIDKRGLIRDSYVIDGITAGECRSIFLDWALFDDHAMAQGDRIKALLDHYGALHPEHPMSAVLKDALQNAATPKRRGGRAGRVQDS